MKILFWLSFAAILYTYLGYPLLLWISSFLFTQKVKKSYYEPFVSIIISAFNEENWIKQKICNLLASDYPPDKLEILVGSDGALDKTDFIVSQFDSERVRFFRFVVNQGKPQVLNSLVREAKGEVLIFNDARQTLHPNAIRELAANFSDPNVGCVSGELHLEEMPHSPVSKGMGRYWTYEKFLRRCESQIGSMLGATGAIYAVRRFLFSVFPAHMLVDDMYLPISIIRQGYRAIFEPAAKAFDRSSSEGRQEFRRKVRTLAGNYQIFQQFPDLLNPFQGPIGWQMISHKFLRLLIPFFMMGLYFSNLFLLDSFVYLIFFICQNLFYAIAVIGFSGQTAFTAVPYTFCLLNYSAVAGLVKYLTHKSKANWEKAYA